MVGDVRSSGRIGSPRNPDAVWIWDPYWLAPWRVNTPCIFGLQATKAPSLCVGVFLFLTVWDNVGTGLLTNSICAVMMDLPL